MDSPTVTHPCRSPLRIANCNARVPKASPGRVARIVSAWQLLHRTTDKQGSRRSASRLTPGSLSPHQERPLAQGASNGQCQSLFCCVTRRPHEPRPRPRWEGEHVRPFKLRHDQRGGHGTVAVAQPCRAARFCPGPLIPRPKERQRNLGSEHGVLAKWGHKF